MALPKGPHRLASKYLPLHTFLAIWQGQKVIFPFSKSCHVAYQINLNEAENTLQVNILLFYIPMVPGWDQKGNIFLKKVMLHYKLKERSVVGTLCKRNVYPYAHPWPFGLGK